MDRLDAMNVFVAVVETGTLSAAARRLGSPLPTVSRKVSELESHLGTRLLNRTTRRLALTEAGRSYFAACKGILEQLGEAERAVSGEYRAPKGELAIAAPIVFGRLHVLPVVVAFLKAYPEIDIRMVLSDRVAHFLEDHIDLAVRIGELPDSNFVATRLGEVRRVVCASPEYFSRHGVPNVPSEVTKHDCVSFEPLMASNMWVFRNGESDAAVAVHSRLTVNTAEAAIGASISGLGLVRVLSYQAANGLKEGLLEMALESFEPAPWPVHLVHAGQGPLPLKTRAFLDFAAPRIRASLAAV